LSKKLKLKKQSVLNSVSSFQVLAH
jgi:hypothetical protein